MVHLVRVHIFHIHILSGILKPQGLRQSEFSVHLGNDQSRVINLQVSARNDEALKHR